MLPLITWCQDDRTCGTSKDETCQAASSASTTATTKMKLKTRSIRVFDQTTYCTSPGSGVTRDLYQHGGSAQAYRPNAAVSSTVCPKAMANEVPYKASSWPFTRRTTRKGSAPTLDITLHLWTCQPKLDNNNVISTCACSPVAISESNEARTAMVEVWQTKPDGRYTSLRSSSDDQDCRATVPISEQGDVTFSTVAPGSTGIMAGLSPSSSWFWWGGESSPYGPPTIHLLVQAPHHEALLLDLPVLLYPKTLEQRPFSFSSLEWRGLSWSRRRKQKNGNGALPYKIVSWIPNKENNHIDVEINIFLKLAADETSSTPNFCPSSFFLPGSFFLQPIAVCARYLLDFFEL